MRPVTRTARALLLALILHCIQVPAHAADPQPYDVTFKPSGDAELDAAIQDSAVLAALREKAPVGGFAMVARARADKERFETALRAFGYYNGTVSVTIDGKPVTGPDLAGAIDNALAARPSAIEVTVATGPRFHLGRIVIEGAPASLTPSLGLTEGQDARAAEVLAAKDRLLAAARDAGYPLAAVILPPAIVYRDQQRLDVLFQVQTGPRAVLGPISFDGLRRMSEAYMRRRLILHPGDQFSASAFETARRDLASIGVFASVRVLPADKLDNQGDLPVRIDVVERPLRAVDLGAAWSTDLGASASASWLHRNLFGGAEQLQFTGALQLGGNATVKPGYRAGARYLEPDFMVRDQSLEISVNAIKDSLWAYDQTALIGRVTLNRKLSPHWTVTAGVMGAREEIRQGGATRAYHLLGVPVTAKYDSTNNLFDPVSGIRATLSVTPVQSFSDPGGTFVILQGAGSTYFDVLGDGRTTVALRGVVGQVVGAGVFGLPPDQRFYAGGSATVRGYRFQSIGPRFANGRPAGGTAVSAGTIEFRQRIFSRFGAAAFIDAGQVSADGNPFGGTARAGAGVGLRYYTPIGPIRLEVAVPLNRQPGGDQFELYIGLGQAF